LLGDDRHYSRQTRSLHVSLAKRNAVSTDLAEEMYGADQIQVSHRGMQLPRLLFYHQRSHNSIQHHPEWQLIPSPAL
jgi:hypothetical protein